jgi:hypothetical protein
MNEMKKFLMPMLAALIASGCASVPQTVPNPVLGDAPVFQRNQKVCVVVPKDASFAGDEYPGSGRAVAQKVADSLERIAVTSSLISAIENDLDKLCTERAGEFIIEPEIIHYEDHATGWSGRPDRIEVRISAFRFDAHQMKRLTVVEASSNIAASGLIEWGNAPPHSLLSSNLDPVLEGLLYGNQTE